MDEGIASDGLSELEANVDTIFNFIRENSETEIGMCTREELTAFLKEFMRQRLASLSVPSSNLATCRLDVLKYFDFLALISSKNRDFTELMLQR